MSDLSIQDTRPSETTIKSLFDEILESIFAFLDSESLKQASLVYQNWSAIIGSTEKVMKTWNLRVGSDFLQFCTDFHSTRKYQTITIEHGPLNQAIMSLQHFNTSQLKVLHSEKRIVWRTSMNW